MKDASIVEGGLARKFNTVQKLKISRTDGGLQEWIPQDEAGEYINTKDKTITENGTYVARNDGCDAYKELTVAFPVSVKSITHDGTYRAADENLDGFTPVIVDVNYHVGEKRILEDGEYNAFDDGLDGYKSVIVRVPPHPLPPMMGKRITKSGQYRAVDDGVVGYDSVSVSVETKPSTYPSGREVTGIADKNMKDFETVRVYTDGGQNHIAGETQYPRTDNGDLLGLMKGSCDEGDEGTVIVLFD